MGKVAPTHTREIAHSHPNDTESPMTTIFLSLVDIPSGAPGLHTHLPWTASAVAAAGKMRVGGCGTMRDTMCCDRGRNDSSECQDERERSRARAGVPQGGDLCRMRPRGPGRFIAGGRGEGGRREGEREKEEAGRLT